MAFKSSNQDDYAPVAEINITPLVDVMLVLLIIFMVAAPMMENGIPIQLPKANAKALPKSGEPVILNISREGKFYFGKEEISGADLARSLQQIARKTPNREVFIRADGSLTYGFVAQTMALVKQSGISKLGLVTLPAESKSDTAKK